MLTCVYAGRGGIHTYTYTYAGILNQLYPACAYTISSGTALCTVYEKWQPGLASTSMIELTPAGAAQTGLPPYGQLRSCLNGLHKLKLIYFRH